MKCPICKKDFDDEKYAPFCSKRCADIDLGNWFNEKYHFEATEVDENDLMDQDIFKNQESNSNK